MDNMPALDPRKRGTPTRATRATPVFLRLQERKAAACGRQKEVGPQGLRALLACLSAALQDRLAPPGKIQEKSALPPTIGTPAGAAPSARWVDTP